jgi:hypothetical protein
MGRNMNIDSALKDVHDDLWRTGFLTDPVYAVDVYLVYFNPFPSDLGYYREGDIYIVQHTISDVFRRCLGGQRQWRLTFRALQQAIDAGCPLTARLYLEDEDVTHWVVAMDTTGGPIGSSSPTLAAGGCSATTSFDGRSSTTCSSRASLYARQDELPATSSCNVGTADISGVKRKNSTGRATHGYSWGKTRDGGLRSAHEGMVPPPDFERCYWANFAK